MARPRKKASLWPPAIIIYVILAGGLVQSVRDHHYSDVAALAFFLTAPWTYWLLFKRKVVCGVALVTTGRPCPKTAPGLIVGCKKHRLEKPAVRLRAPA